MEDKGKLLYEDRFAINMTKNILILVFVLGILMTVIGYSLMYFLKGWIFPLNIGMLVCSGVVVILVFVFMYLIMSLFVKTVYNLNVYTGGIEYNNKFTIWEDIQEISKYPKAKLLKFEFVGYGLKTFKGSGVAIFNILDEKKFEEAVREAGYFKLIKIYETPPYGYGAVRDMIKGSVFKRI